MMRSLADRLEAVRRTLPGITDHPSQAAWPMTHLVAIAAEASDEYLFQVADPKADRLALAAFAATASRTGEALAAVAGAATRLLDPGGAHGVQQAIADADALAANTARDLGTVADLLTDTAPAPVVPLHTDELHQRRTAQAAAAAARSRIVSAQPASTSHLEPATPTAPVIPLRRGH
ncbi:hypothetical protein ACFVVA_13080 [Kitasatospora sp. NPDC058048]|uniref:hypothetical protein n=1 Tax=Kitasatospora sp. NPDC058048 TaxID=3346313 RepID=UPI0036D8746F